MCLCHWSLVTKRFSLWQRLGICYQIYNNKIGSERFRSYQFVLCGMICKRTSTIVSGCQQHWFMKHFVIFSFLYFTYFLKFLLFVESSWRALSFIYAAYISNIVISKHWRKLTTICIVVVMAVLTSYQPLVVEPSILSKESSILLVVNTKSCLTHGKLLWVDLFPFLCAQEYFSRV